MGAALRQRQGEGDQAASLAETDIYDVLKNERRQRVVERLADCAETQSVRALSEHIAAIETDTETPPRNVRHSVYVSLCQTHIPKLDDLDIVDYDADAKDVAPGRHTATVAAYLTDTPTDRARHDEYYLGLGVVGSLLVAAGVLGAPILSTAPAIVGLTFLALTTLAAGFFVARGRLGAFGTLGSLSTLRR
ncbi:hypothetical protein AUR64_18005 [Haloprofundus marisrubri]|uniref:DUF7344 domain-containing protein n=1 Tax=Haloprofundus marisrubri TaxID=1514971 RepID=A0A0W1R5I2_9EURY|nr:hypothetical protein [Haloprofundus marisrubri]KTG08570.1 hypothetical protein AUR64_18005 [Haloprofundus marisrubri]